MIIKNAEYVTIIITIFHPGRILENRPPGKVGLV